MNTLTNNKQGQTIPIYYYKLAGYLQLKGFVLLDCKLNYKSNDNKLVYYFKKSLELQQAIKEFKEAKEKHTILTIQL